jgi:tetratricopeptide (TPR) repeat protein
MRRRLFIAGTAAALAAAVLALGGALRSGHAAPAAAPSKADAGLLGSGFAAGDTEGLVLQLQAGLRQQPDNVRGLGLLGLAYLQRARETGDPAWYVKADGVLHRTLRRAPRDLIATDGLGSLALSRHRFADSLEIGRSAVSLSPSTSAAYGIVGDSLVELGRYRDAFQTFDHMAALKPGLPSYARVSYARELSGDHAGAEAAMELAASGAIGQAEPTAWVQVQLGKLDWARGRYTAAATHDRAALRALPGYVYALDALAQVAAARGELTRAIAFEKQASATIPLPQFVGMLGDLERAARHPQAAKRSYALVGVIDRLLRANGVRTDLETALFRADHGVKLQETLRLARTAQRSRPSIDGDDVLAWTLERNGRCAEALQYSQLALRLGTEDALKFFHRGMIERCLGRQASAQNWFKRALALNPHFSLLWTSTARRYAQ